MKASAVMPRRQDFLRLVAASLAGAALPRRAHSGPQQAAAPASAAEEFAGRVMEDFATACRGALCYIGDRLGIFKAMALAGPQTADELARKTKLNARLLREWLNAMATAGYVVYHPATKRYELSAAQAAVLADEESSELFAGGMMELLVPMIGASNRVAGAFRTGQPVTMDDFAPELFEGMERASAPEFKHQLVQKWIAAMPETEIKLRGGGAAVDVGCGSGVASIVLARAFPQARFFGYDPHAASIARARKNAAAAGVSGRVQFVAADASKLPAGQFDLLTIFNSLHHFSEPVGLLASARRSLAAGGTCFIVDAALSPRVEENKNTAGRGWYASTTLWCLHDSMANGGAGIGSDMSEELMRELARKSGFTRFRRLTNRDPYEGLYELKA